MIQKISESTGGKVGIGVVVVAAVGIAVFVIFGSVKSSSGYGTQISVKDAGASAQKAIDALQSNDKIPDAVKRAEIAHLQVQVDAAAGRNAPAPKPPTPGG